MLIRAQKVEIQRFIKRNFGYDDILELIDVLEQEIDERITLGKWDDHETNLTAPQHYKFYAEEEEALNEL